MTSPVRPRRMRRNSLSTARALVSPSVQRIQSRVKQPLSPASNALLSNRFNVEAGAGPVGLRSSTTSTATTEPSSPANLRMFFDKENSGNFSPSKITVKESGDKKEAEVVPPPSPFAMHTPKHKMRSRGKVALALQNSPRQQRIEAGRGTGNGRLNMNDAADDDEDEATAVSNGAAAKPIGLSTPSRKMWQSVFSTKVDSAICNLDDVMLSMEQQLQAMEAKHAMSFDTSAGDLTIGSPNSELGRKLERVTAEKMRLEDEVEVLNEKLTQARAESSFSDKRSMSLTRSIREKMDKIAALEDQLKTAYAEVRANVEAAARAKRTASINTGVHSVFANRSAAALAKLQTQYDDMVVKYFSALVIAIKMSYASQGTYLNFSIQELYQRSVDEGIDAAAWPTWLGNVAEEEVTRMNGSIQ